MVTGPEHPWLVAAYAESVPHPFGSVIGQEFFELGLIPSDTDFRIFRDFGQIPGIHQSPLLLFEKKNRVALSLALSTYILFQESLALFANLSIGN